MPRFNVQVAIQFMGESGKAVEQAFRSMAGSAERSLQRVDRVAKMVSRTVGLIATSAVARQVLQTIASYEQLRAQLETITGSAENAQVAFAGVQKMAAKTPFSVEGLTQAFIKLGAQGVAPTEARLLSYGNTAAAMGKDVLMFIEAVLDAQTGEFERLKEFGIKAKSEGDKVSFTFRGMTTTVGKNASEIVGYLDQIGQKDFAGAMERQSKTLAGAWSNLKDGASQLADQIGQGGLGGALNDLASDFSGAAGEGEEFGRQLGMVLGLVVDAVQISVKGVVGVLGSVFTVGLAIGRAFTQLVGGLYELGAAAANLLGREKEASVFGALAADAAHRVTLQNDLIAGSLEFSARAFDSADDAVGDLMKRLSDSSSVNAASSKSFAEVANSLDKVNTAATKAGAAVLKVRAPDRLEVTSSARSASQGHLRLITSTDEAVVERVRADLRDINASAERWAQAQFDVARALKLGEVSAEEAERILAKIAEETGVVSIRAKEVTEEGWEKWVELGQVLATTLDGIDSKMGDFAKSVLGAVAAFKQLAAAQKKAQDEGKKFTAETVQGMIAIGAQTAAMAESLGIAKSQGQSGYGGKTEGNYGAEGAMVGAIIGGIIGTIYGGNTAAGAQIGGAIGAVAGSMIKKGADFATGQILKDGARLQSSITRADTGGLGGAISGLGRNIIAGVEQILATLGGAITNMPLVGFKIREDVISVTVGAVRAKFNSMDQAMSFAVAEIMKQGAVTGMSENVKAAIGNSLADDLQGLLSDIDFARYFDRVGMDPIQVAIEDFVAKFRSDFERATQLGMDPSRAGDALGQNLSGMRDQILGIRESPQERMRREAAMYNSQVGMIRAEQTAKLADLQFKRAMLKAEVEIQRVAANVSKAQLETETRRLDAQSKILTAERQLLNATLMQLNAVDAAITAAEALLSGLPDLISDSDLAKGLGRIGGGGGRNRGQELAERRTAALERIRQLQERLVLGELSPYGNRQKVSIAANEFERIAQMALRGNVKAMERLPEIAESYLGLYRGAYGSTGGYSTEFNRVNEILSTLLRRGGIAPIQTGPFGTDNDANRNAAVAYRMLGKLKSNTRGNLTVADDDHKMETGRVKAEVAALKALTTETNGLLREIRDGQGRTRPGGGGGTTEQTTAGAPGFFRQTG